MNCCEIMQGDQYDLLFVISVGDLQLTNDDVIDIEIVIGTLRKTKPAVTYDTNLCSWRFPISQRDSFAMPVGEHKIQIRVLFPGGNVIGNPVGVLYVIPSDSQEVLNGV